MNIRIAIVAGAMVSGCAVFTPADLSRSSSNWSPGAPIDDALDKNDVDQAWALFASSDDPYSDAVLKRLGLRVFTSIPSDVNDLLKWEPPIQIAGNPSRIRADQIALEKLEKLRTLADKLPSRYSTELSSTDIDEAKSKIIKHYENNAPEIFDHCSQSGSLNCLDHYPVHIIGKIDSSVYESYRRSVFSRKSEARAIELQSKAQELVEIPNSQEAFQALLKASRDVIEHLPKGYLIAALTPRTLAEQPKLVSWLEGVAAVELRTPTPSRVLSSLSSGTRFLLAVDASPTFVSRKELRRERVTSKFMISEQFIPNPDYQRLQTAISSAQYRAQLAQQSAATQQQGFGKGFAQGQAIVAQNEVNELYAQLQMTPSTIKAPVYSPYDLDEVTYGLTTEQPRAFILLDVREGTYSTFEENWHGAAEVSVHEGVRAGDPNYSERNKSIADIQRESVEKTGLFNDLKAFYESATFSSRGNSAAAMTQFSARQDESRVSYAQRASNQGTARQTIEMRSVVVVDTGYESIGSGFYVDKHHVITNAHVVQKVTSVRVRMSDATKATCFVKNIDSDVDLALLRCDNVGQPAELGQSRALSPGDSVRAIGHPNALEFSVTTGAISAFRRRRADSGRYVSLIQTDTPVNPGNSGGPLMKDGAVVGVVTWKYSGAEGLGFAIDVDEVIQFLNRSL